MFRRLHYQSWPVCKRCGVGGFTLKTLFIASVSSRAHGHHPIRCQLGSHHRKVWQQLQHVAAGPAGQTKHLQHQRLWAQHDQHHLQVKHCNTLVVDFARFNPSFFGSPFNKSVHTKHLFIAFYFYSCTQLEKLLLLLLIMIPVKPSHFLLSENVSDGWFYDD